MPRTPEGNEPICRRGSVFCPQNTQNDAETGRRLAGAVFGLGPPRRWTHSAPHFLISFLRDLRGYEVCATSGPAKLSQQLQDGRRQGHHRALLVLLTSRWAYGRCSKSTF